MDLEQDNQIPTYQVMPEGDWSYGAADEAASLYELTGRKLDRWQRDGLKMGLAERPNGTPACFEYATIVGRQNGKGDEIEAAEMYWLFMAGEPLITHSAHEFKTAREAWVRMVSAVQCVPDFDKQIARVPRSHGEEGIELKNGHRLQYMARTGSSGRGFTGSKIVMDEAMILSVAPVAALVPTLATKPNAQVFYYGSAGSITLPTGSEQLAAVRKRAYSKDPRKRGRLAFREWAMAPEGFDERGVITAETNAENPAVWKRTNPTFGIRISEEYVEDEMRIFSGSKEGPKGFARERCGRGEWPNDDGWEIISEELWMGLANPESHLLGKLSMSVDTTPDGAWTSVAVAGMDQDGWLYVELIQHRPGTAWVGEYVAERKAKHRPLAVVVDPNSPARRLIRELGDNRVKSYQPVMGEVAEWCQFFKDVTVKRSQLRHNGDDTLKLAVQNATQVNVADGGWRWARRATTADISPLCAVTLALGGYLVHARRSIPLAAAG